MKNELTKDRVIETITDILIDVVGWIERDEISPDKHFVRDMHIVDNDLDAFAMEVLKHFGIRLPFGECYRIGTVEDLAELVIEYLLQSDDPINDPNRSIPADSISRKLSLILPALAAGLGRLFVWFACWVVGLVISGFLMANTDWPFVLVMIPGLLWIAFTSWLIFRERKA